MLSKQFNVRWTITEVDDTGIDQSHQYQVTIKHRGNTTVKAGYGDSQSHAEYMAMLTVNEYFSDLTMDNLAARVNKMWQDQGTIEIHTLI